MASTKTFADMKKPVRRPTPDEIAAFEETGKAARALDPAVLATETQKPVNPERDSDKGETPMMLDTQKSVSTEAREHANTEASIYVNPATQEHRSPPSRTPEKAETQDAAKAETSKATNTETRIGEPTARLTIDLPETVHTRFKTACVMTKRKMVEEVRAFIEQRTAELERESGRAV
jgi:hypothetical protein